MALKLEPWLARLAIVDKDGHANRLDINSQFAWAQRELCHEVEKQYNAGKPVRIIVLKARQLGSSTVTAAICFLWAFFNDNAQGLIVAHENDTAQSLFEKTQHFWDNAPWGPGGLNLFSARHATQRRLVWSNGSSMRIASAKNLGAGVGRTIHMLHTSEAALYAEPEILMVGLRQTMPRTHGTIEVVESTARGIGNWFHEQWQAAVLGESRYVPLFFPWYKHYEYRALSTMLTVRDLNEEEQRLQELGAPLTAIEWRRETLIDQCNGDEDYFRQEYPATPDEAFIASGTNVFNLMRLQKRYAPDVPKKTGRIVSQTDDGFNPRFVDDDHGELTVFRTPSSKYDEARYFVAGDPSMAVVGDPACIQVINRGTLEQVAVWHGRCDPIAFAHHMMLIGQWYHNAELCPEAEGGGQQTVATIINAGYPRLWVHRWFDRAPGKLATSYGFSTNYNRKHAAIAALQRGILEDIVTLHDPVTFYQMQNYIRTTAWGEMGPASRDGHDDAVMALAIAIVASQTEGIYTPNEQRPPTPSPDLYLPQGV